MPQEKLNISSVFQNTQNKKLCNSVFITTICITLLRFYCQRYSAIINNNKYNVTDYYNPSEPITTENNKDKGTVTTIIRYKNIYQEPCQKPYHSPHQKTLIKPSLKRGHYRPFIPHQS